MDDLAGYLQLGRLERYYRQSGGQLPRVLLRAAVDPSELKFSRWRDGALVAGARIWLFRLPSGQVVAALSLDARCAFLGTIDFAGGLLLRRCPGGRRVPREQHVHAMAAGLGADGSAERVFLSERQQMVLFGHDPVSDGCKNQVQRMTGGTRARRRTWSASRTGLATWNLSCPTA